ncbi:MAG TPA: cobalamin-dependent protein [Tepidisphaeraceae bacterium]|jgi:methylmalonyl-CoA mutase|nr:cobalamin-dependent protein [Tepidisphaeraceae bacterium]
MTKRPTTPIRLLTAVPICDGHDSAISTINLEFIRHGIEVIYLGYHRSARDIARAAVQEDVRAIGISSYNGGHVEFFAQVVKLLREYGAHDIGVFGGGGGTITHADAALMHKKGVNRIFFAGTPLAEMVDYVKETWGDAPPTQVSAKNHARPDHCLGRLLTAAVMADGRSNGKKTKSPSSRAPRNGDATGARPRLVVGVCGPGGAGKTTLIDELVLRFLRAAPASRVAVLSHDPSIVGSGALLGDRAAMFYSQDDRVFMRSLATGGRAGGLSPATERCLQILKHDPDGKGFDVVLVETVGIGQEAVPFAPGVVDKTIFVMSPEYGSRLQLQKIAMLDAADIAVVNKSDLAAAKTASNEVEQRLALNQRGQKLLATVAKRHRDAGVDALFDVLKGTVPDEVATVRACRVGGDVTCV